MLLKAALSPQLLSLVVGVGVGATGVGACSAVRTVPLRDIDVTQSSAPLGVDSGTVTVNGTTLFYEAAGHGSVVVLLHAGNLDRRVWDPQFLPLAREHRVIRYDQRGYGRSGPADAPYRHHEDLRALLDG
jgi:hypothetical protein